MQQERIHIVGPGTVHIGERTTVGADVQVIFHRPGSLTIGDYCVLGQGVKFVCADGDVSLGDWTTLHDRCLVLSGAGVSIGQHGWFGQHCVIDGTGGLKIGNGVRVGMYSQIWSHVAAGEQIEGCTLFGEREVVVEDDVWLVGSCIVASGVRIGARTTALIGSNITKSCAAGSVLAGVPASPKQGLSFYRDVSAAQKWEMLLGWLSAMPAVQVEPLAFNGAGLIVRLSWRDQRSDDCVLFAANTADVPKLRGADPQATICCVQSKRYEKRLSDLEHLVLKQLAGNKARFLAAE